MNFLRVLLYSSLILLAGALVYNFFFLEEQSKPSRAPDMLADEAIIPLDKFNVVEVGGSIYMEVTKGNKRTYEVLTEDPALRERVVVKQKGDKLAFDLSRGWQDYGDIQILLTTPEIQEVILGGTSHLRLSESFRQAALGVDLSGGAYFDGTIAVNMLKLSQSGSSRLKLEGSAREVQARLSGSSSFMGKGLTAQIMDIRASGSAQADIQVVQSLSAKASGAASIKCKGAPNEVTKSTSGAGTVKIESSLRQPNNQL